MKEYLTLLCLLIAPASLAAEANRASVPYSSREGLANTMQKLNQEQEVRIAYLGGSITEQEGWRVMTQQWFGDKFLKAHVVEILAAIGGTNSELGAFRIGQDVLLQDPDLVFIEFAGNDARTPPTRLRETMEGIVRQILQHNPSTDICFVYTIKEASLGETQDGLYFTNAASTMEEVAEHYGIPSINMGYKVPKLVANNELLMRQAKPTTKEDREALAGKILFAEDGVHPYVETGHPIYFEQVQKALPELLKTGQARAHAIPEALEPNNFEDARMIPITETNFTGSWTTLNDLDGPTPNRLKNRADNIWVGKSPDASLSFKFKGSYIGIFGARGPDSGAYDFSIDGNLKESSSFDKYCTYHRLSSDTLAAGLSDQVHEVKINTSDRQIDKLSQLKERNSENDYLKNPEKYADNNLYLSALMIRGELIED
ncbi:SGNH/GDSL hydrolase family protein [Rubellicoccus peritrichatus]|uniref:SGNH/GDSL hydrolase family protein n=1 Tax=Rubellicoccus peritrichatus TaxID=3080537 RepID=A0AAQ3LAR4_9BACT|nr:SGNH/GDSL hydrolase family protein [Puniceicoccus sp. CR14]WOO40063.1 SGNH/GDSL hydrolase family protein [Puniceicoccus sp. CR14]